MRGMWPVLLAAVAAVWSIWSGNNFAFVVSLWLGVVWVGWSVHTVARDRNREVLDDLALRRLAARYGGHSGFCRSADGTEFECSCERGGVA